MVAAEYSLNIENKENSPAFLVSQDEELGQVHKPLDRVSSVLRNGLSSRSQLHTSCGSNSLGNKSSTGHQRRSQIGTRISVEDHSSTWHLDIETGNIQQDLIRPFELIKSTEILTEDDSPRRHCCGLRGASKRIEQAGGDFPFRLGEALRASLGTCIYFSAMVFPHPKYLGCIWIGNIFFHSSLKGNIGETVKTASDFAKSIVITTLISWPVTYLLECTTEHVAQICLPLCTVVLSVWIMICPWLSSPNLMILVMYVMIAAPPRFETTWWEPLGYLGSYLIGLGMAVFMQLVCIPPSFQPNSATTQVHNLMERLSKDFFLLFVQLRYYTQSTGNAPKLARAAGAAIEVLVSRMSETILNLKGLLPAVTDESVWRKKEDSISRLKKWIEFLECIVADMKMLRCALNSRFLGEEESGSSATITTLHIRHIIATELGEDYYQFIDSLIHLTIACNRQADPTVFDPAVQTNGFDYTQVSDLLTKTKADFGRALNRVIKEVRDSQSKDDKIKTTMIPIFAHLARRSTSFSSLFHIGSSLVEYCENFNEMNTAKDNEGKGSFAKCCEWFSLQSLGKLVEFFWKPSWPWRDPQKRRLALKTAVGMMFASLWISVPQLWEISQPFGLWPGLTVASVNLATTGSSFHKAIDRLVGTLFAAAYASLLVDFFAGDADSAKIPAITVFTFAAIFLKKDEHAYQYSYAATSIGSMMYGSVKNSYDVEGYIPMRIQLIFVGVITFALIELFLFPRSSRVIVETQILEYFDLTNKFFHKARHFAATVHETTKNQQEQDDDESILCNNIEVTKSGKKQVVTDSMQDLVRAEAALRTTSVALKIELRSALLEPYFGFSQKLHPESVNGIVSEMCESETQALLLVKALKMVADYATSSNQRSNATLQRQWLHMYVTMLDMAGRQMDVICQDLAMAYPDGRFRPKDGNTIRAIAAAASFRDLRDVRLHIITSWSDLFQEFVGNVSFFDPNELIVMGITTSFLLELCRHMQLAGRKMEWSSGHFPFH